VSRIIRGRGKRLVKVFRVRYEHSSTKAAEYIVVATSEIRALEEVVGIRHGFSSKDTLNDARARFGCTVSAKPWMGSMPTISRLVSVSVGAA
jgi:hypothetical protein